MLVRWFHVLDGDMSYPEYMAMLYKKEKADKERSKELVWRF